MTAPTYSRFPHAHVWHTGPLRCEWEVTDGIGGRVLSSGHTWTRTGADRDSGIAQALCEPSLALRLERAADRLRREGLPVRVRQDEQGRVCVTPLCECKDQGHRRIMCALTPVCGSVRWEVA